MTRIVNTNRRRVLLSTLASIVAGRSGAAGAADDAPYPTRAVTFVVPYGPGGVVDVTARALADGLSTAWSQAVVVENKPGAAGVIGANNVAKADGNGYRLLYTDDGVMVSMPHFQRDLPYDPLKDLTPIAMVATYPYIVFANARAGFHSLDDVVKAAKAKPGTINFATNGVGSTHHLAWERFQREAGIRLTHVPYKSAMPALQDVLAGHVPLMTVALSTAAPFLSNPALVALANTSTARSALLPNVPTVAELGYPGFEAVGWLGLFAPSAMPAPLLKRIGDSVAKVTNGPAFAQTMKSLGAQSQWTSSSELAARMRKEYDRNGVDITALNLTAAQ